MDLLAYSPEGPTVWGKEARGKVRESWSHLPTVLKPAAVLLTHSASCGAED